jgi:hypothetical protein
MEPAIKKLNRIMAEPGENRVIARVLDPDDMDYLKILGTKVIPQLT